MKLNKLIILALLCFSCSQSFSPSYTIYTAEGGENIEQDIASLGLDQNGDPKIDEYHRINQEYFLPTNLYRPEKIYHIKSSISNTVYECNLEKGDIILIPEKGVTYR